MKINSLGSEAVGSVPVSLLKLRSLFQKGGKKKKKKEKDDDNNITHANKSWGQKKSAYRVYAIDH